MKYVAFVFGIFATMAGPASSQASFAPTELPPEGFEGREFTDSRGCIFLRSTFGGEVTWIPRFGPDRQPVCDGTPTSGGGAAAQNAAASELATPAPEPEPEAVPQAPVAEAPVAAPSRPAPQPRAEERPRQPAAPPRPAQADASGRHRDCPPNAPYGQLVRTAEGRTLVRCVTSPSLFLN